MRKHFAFFGDIICHQIETPVVKGEHLDSPHHGEDAGNSVYDVPGKPGLIYVVEWTYTPESRWYSGAGCEIHPAEYTEKWYLGLRSSMGCNPATPVEVYAENAYVVFETLRKEVWYEKKRFIKNTSM